MTKLIINTDDFGYSRSVNYGVLDSHRLGILTSGTLMANMPGFEHGVQIAKENPDFGVGVHLVLDCGKPLLKTHELLMDEKGIFHSFDAYASGEVKRDEAWKAELEAEWDAQIQKVMNAGIKPTHFDAHHHMHLRFEETQEIVFKLATKYNMPVRRFERYCPVFPDNIRHTDYFVDGFDQTVCELITDEDALLKYFNEVIDDILKHDIVELMVHAGYLDYSVLYGSSWTTVRATVIKAITDSPFVDLVHKNNIELVNYSILCEK